MQAPKRLCWIVLLVMSPQLVGCLQPAGMNEFRTYLGSQLPDSC